MRAPPEPETKAARLPRPEPAKRMVALKAPLAPGVALDWHRTLPDPSVSTSWMVWPWRVEVPETLRGLATEAPLVGLRILIGLPGAAVSGGVVVEELEADEAEVVEVVEEVDWALTPSVVEVDVEAE